MTYLEMMAGFLSGALGGPASSYGHFPNIMASGDYTWPLDITLSPIELDTVLPGANPEGLIPAAFRNIELGGYNLDCWDPGPTVDQYNAWLQTPVDNTDSCDSTCLYEPVGYDRFDMIAASMREAYLWIAALRNKSSDELAETWDDWIDYVYMSEEDTSTPDAAELSSPSTIRASLASTVSCSSNPREDMSTTMAPAAPVALLVSDRR